ncbi:hypothetical protein ACLJB4_09805, partial [Campylobacter coli]|uniref:hypothetical protein n=1 Tax=Campylobacter coli TaxID=195 RepID=UPI003F7BB9EA
PDIVWTGSQLVVAWTDTSSGSQVRYRRFTDSLVALDIADQTLSTITASEDSNVALSARDDGGWAAAWISASGGNAVVAVSAGT